MSRIGTLQTVLEAGADDHLALVVPGGPSYTYRRLREEVARAADMLAGYGIGRQDRVALVYPNSAEAVVFFLAAAAAGAAAPLNQAYKEDEFRFYLQDTGARALLVPPGAGEDARRALPAGALLIEASIDADGSVAMSSSKPRSAATASAPGEEDVALILHTSGTTSRPKAVPLKHLNLAASVANIIPAYRLTPDDVSVCVMPLFHVHGLVASTLASFGSGGTVVVPAKFNPMGFWPVVKEYGGTWFSAVPTIHQMLLMRTGTGPRPEGAEGLRFIRSCSSALSPATMAQLEERFGAPVLEAYGMSEASHQMSSNPLPPARREPGSVGRGTGVEIAIMDEEGTLVQTGGRGEVVIRGANVITAYENNPEANQKSFTNGWFRTGDQGILDEDGYLRLIGRLKEMINRGGEKIAPGEIDEVLLQHPAVGEAVAFASPHPTWGEEVAAAVVLKGEVTEKELIKHCRDRLADFKVPRSIHIVEQIPRTATGKIQRRNVAASVGPDSPNRG